jgi:hypothetical protein
MTPNRYVIVKPYRQNVWFYEGRQYMSNELHKGVKIYKKIQNAQKVLNRLHVYDRAWIIVPVSI